MAETEEDGGEEIYINRYSVSVQEGKPGWLYGDRCIHMQFVDNIGTVGSEKMAV